MKNLFFPIALLLLAGACKKELETVKNYEGDVLIESYTQRTSDQAKHGEYVRYHPNGEKSEVAWYENDTLHGTQTFYSPEGRIQEVVQFNRGTYEGPYTSYHENGEVESEGQYIGGAMEGVWKFYYDTGQLKEEVTFKESDEFGPFVEYHPNGNLKAEGTYRGSDELTSNPLGMPPIAYNVLDKKAMERIARWIDSLKSSK